MTGTDSTMARTTAKPMMWVKLTLPPRVRPRYPLMIRRLTSSSFAGTSRKLVAVGTERLDSMFVTMRAATPRRGSPGTSTSAAVTVGAAAAFSPPAGGGVGGVGGVAATAGVRPDGR